MAANNKLRIYVNDDLHKWSNLYRFRVAILDHWLHDLCAQAGPCYSISFLLCGLFFSSYNWYSVWRCYCLLSWRLQSQICLEFAYHSSLDVCCCHYPYTIYVIIKHFWCASMEPSFPWRFYSTYNDWFNAWCSFLIVERLS